MIECYDYFNESTDQQVKVGQLARINQLVRWPQTKLYANSIIYILIQILMSNSKIPTFQENMSKLHEAKQQLLRLHHIYSPESVNFHQLSLISKLRNQIHSSQDTIEQTHNHLIDKNKQLNQQISLLRSEKQELQEVNMKLVHNNEEMIKKFENAYASLEEANHTIEQQRIKACKIQDKYKKQIETMKLIHSQELYILKKKQKKTHAL